VLALAAALWLVGSTLSRLVTNWQSQFIEPGTAVSARQLPADPASARSVSAPRPASPSLGRPVAQLRMPRVPTVRELPPVDFRNP
jgi:hypothetical protein